ncbi:MAG: hypothetical protein QXM75_02395 [Candidatus Diapherotrites archaeon]
MVQRPVMRRSEAPRERRRLRKIEDRLRKTGKIYRYGGSTLTREQFVGNFVRDGYNRGDVEIALKILENRAGVSTITDMDLLNFLKFELPKIKRHT